MTAEQRAAAEAALAKRDIAEFKATGRIPAALLYGKTIGGGRVAAEGADGGERECLNIFRL